MAPTLRKLALAAGCSLLMAAGALAQFTGAITGTVTGEDGQPYRNAIILIERTDMRGNYKTKSNKKGVYFHAGLPTQGTYDVKCEIDGKLVDQIKGVRVRGMEEPTQVNFDMAEMKRKREAMQQAAAAGQISEEQLRGLTKEEQEAIKKQMEERSKTLRKNKELNDAFNAGMAAKQAQQWDVAIQNFEKAVELDPEQHVIWAQLADTYARVSDVKTGAEKEAAVEKAISSYQKVVELKPDDAAYHNNFALVLAKVGRFEDAEAELERAAALNPPGAGQYYYNLGAVLLNSGNTEQSGVAFKRAIEADPNYALAHFQYGMFLLSQAKIGEDGSIIPVEGTRAALEKYLELDPNGPQAESAKGAIQSLSASVETQYVNPDAQRKKK